MPEQEGTDQARPDLKPVTPEVFSGWGFGVTQNGNPEKQEVEQAHCIVGTVGDLEMVEGPNGPVLETDVLIPASNGAPNILIVDYHHKAAPYKHILIQAGCLTNQVDEDFEDQHLDGGEARAAARTGVNLGGPNFNDWEQAKAELLYLREGVVHRPALVNGQLSSLHFIRGEDDSFTGGGRRGTFAALVADFPKCDIQEVVRGGQSENPYERRTQNAHVFNFDMDQLYQEHNVPRDGVLTREQILQSVALRLKNGFKAENYDLVIIAISPGFTNEELVLGQVELFLNEIGLSNSLDVKATK